MPEPYARPEVLVSTDLVAYRFNDPSIAIVEVNSDLQVGYHQGHVPRAVGWDLRTDLEDQVRRDIPSMSQLEDLLGRSGIDSDTTVVLYGDSNNLSATWAFWILKYYRHRDVRLMNGGRRKWIAESRPLSTTVPSPTPKKYRAGVPDQTLRATKEYIVSNLRKPSLRLMDTRTYEEYAGLLSSAPGTPQSDIYRKGHIPGAIHVPWDDGVEENGAFKPAEELRRIYEEKGFSSEQEVISYCRLGVKSSYSWFVAKYLLGYQRVRNYDGSWTEWGNSVGAPIAVDATLIR